MQLEQLGPYRLSRRIGRGGMGTVFEGLNVETAQPAAIKVLNPHLAVEEGFRERFEIEIETLKKLKHPNIVRLYGFGQQDGVIFYAMELVHGANLEDELQAGRRFNWRETTGLGIKLARALQHAHDHGVIHRDLKPANLLLTPDGDLKLADFGIARLFGNTRLTSAGGLVGTAEYMAPEQADGRGVTPQCDLYSLGGVMFAMLAGRPPFWGGSLPEVLQLHRFATPPPVSRFAPDVPAELGDLIARLLSKEPAERGTNARVVAKQLAAMEHALSVPRESAGGGTNVASGPPDNISPGQNASPRSRAAPPARHEFELLPPNAATLPAEPGVDPLKTLPGQIPQPTVDLPASGAFGSGAFGSGAFGSEAFGSGSAGGSADGRLIGSQAAGVEATPGETTHIDARAEPVRRDRPPLAPIRTSSLPTSPLPTSPPPVSAKQTDFRGTKPAPHSPPSDAAPDQFVPSRSLPAAVTAPIVPASAATDVDAPDEKQNSSASRSAAAESGGAHSAPAGAPAIEPAEKRSRPLLGTGAASVLSHDLRLSASAPAVGNRFITVEEDERRRAAADASAHGASWIQISLLSLALAALFGLFWYLMRPPSADTLYGRIESTVGTAGRPERLLDAEDDIQKFLARFPNDPRSKQLKAYADQIELLHLQRQMELAPGLVGGAKDPIARDYAEAIRNAETDPESAADKLQAILTFYGDTPNRSEVTQRFLELSRQQLAQLREQIAASAASYVKLIDANLARAEQLRSNDLGKARAIWSSIVELYGSKPWAAERVAKARAALLATR